MAQLNYAPTKTNLLKLRSDLKFAQQGYELLDQKRNILIIELLALVDQTVDFQSRVDNALAKAYEAELSCLHVVEPLSLAYGGDIPMDLSTIQEQIQDTAKTHLKEFAR